MTFRELFTKAIRETGATEEFIKRATAYADEHCPEAKVDKPLELPPGVTERDAIEGIKKYIQATTEALVSNN